MKTAIKIKKIAYIAFTLCSITAHSTSLDCVAYCTGKVIKNDIKESNVGWIQVTGTGENLKEVISNMRQDCQKKLEQRVFDYSLELGGTYKVKSVDEIFTKYDNGFVFYPKHSCLTD